MALLWIVVAPSITILRRSARIASGIASPRPVSSSVILLIAGQIRERPVGADAFGGRQPARSCEILDERGAHPVRSDLFQATRHIGGGRGDAAIDSDGLLHPVAGPIIEEAVGGGGARRRVLPGGEPPFGVVAQLRPRRRAGAGGGVIGRATGHVATRVIRCGIAGRSAVADAGDSV